VNRKAVALVLLFSMGTGMALPIVVPIIAGVGLFGAGVALEWWFGARPLAEDLQKARDRLYSAWSNDNISNMYLTVNFAERDKKYADIFLTLQNDFAGESDAYVWTVVKARYIEYVMSGMDRIEAIDKTLQILDSIYYNRTKTVFSYESMHAASVVEAWNANYEANQACNNACTLISDPDERSACISACNEPPYFKNSAGTSTSRSQTIVLLNKTFTCSLGTFDYKVPTFSQIISTSGGVVFDEQDYIDLANILCSLRDNLRDNAYNYLLAVSVNVTNVSDILDPITMAVQFSTDWNTTGYYRFAGAEAALTGIPITLNSTVCFEYNATEYCGVMFTNWDNITFTKGDYTVPSGKFVWLITEDNKLIRIGEGETFEITSLTDAEGNPVNSTRVYRYVEHSGDVNKAVEELQKLSELWKEYLDMQAQVSPPSESILDQLTEWWNSLTTEQKVLVVAGAGLGFILLIYALRGRGGGTVVLKG